MIVSWIRNQRRRELLSEPFPSRWRMHFRHDVRHYKQLDPQKRLALERAVQVFVAEKHWDGGAGLEVTDQGRSS